jgi:prepilin-type N-terminal cleavage/methylation domain-containing protein
VPRRNDRPPAHAGFSLLEVLIATVILSVGLLALEGVAVGAARTTAHASRRSLYTAVATDALERTLSALREGQGAAGSATPVTNAAGATIASARVTIVDNGVLAAPSPPLHRYDVSVRVTPVDPADAADSVSLVASVLR